MLFAIEKLKWEIKQSRAADFSTVRLQDILRQFVEALKGAGAKLSKARLEVGLPSLSCFGLGSQLKLAQETASKAVACTLSTHNKRTLAAPFFSNVPRWPTPAPATHFVISGGMAGRVARQPTLACVLGGPRSRVSTSMEAEIASSSIAARASLLLTARPSERVHTSYSLHRLLPLHGVRAGRWRPGLG